MRLLVKVDFIIFKIHFFTLEIYVNRFIIFQFVALLLRLMLKQIYNVLTFSSTQDEYEEIDLIYTEEKKQLLELEERFAALEKEYLAIMEERRIAREKRERAQRELNMLVKAATTIQAFWRSYKVRKALAKKKKKQKGKKGKGKGKGKK